MIRSCYLLAVLLAFFLTASAEAAITVTARGTTANNASSSTTFVISPTSNIAAGSTGVLCLASDNAAGSNASNVPGSLTDSLGNTWLRLSNAINSVGANSGSEITGYYAYLPTGLSTSDTITITFTNAVQAKVAAFWELAPGSGSNRVIADSFTRQSSTGTSQTAPSITSNGNVSIGHVIVGMMAAESPDTWGDDADTTNGTWSASQHSGVGAGAAAMSLTTQYKIETTAASPQTYNTTLTIADAAWAIACFSEVDARVRDIGAKGASDSSNIITVQANLATGSMGVLVVAADNAGTNGSAANLPAGPITDSVGNTWTQRQTSIYDPGAASAGVELAIYTAPITVTMVAGSSTITLSYVNAILNKAWALWEFAPPSGGTIAYAANGTSAGSASASPTVTTSSIANGDIVIGLGGEENTGGVGDGWVGDSDTSNGSWSFAAHIGFNNGGMGLVTQAKTVTAAGTQTFNPTEGAGGTPDTMVSWIELAVTSNANTTNGFFQW